jgi:ribulose 1,5-bisphosphate synthetase/thiazole synthase
VAAALLETTLAAESLLAGSGSRTERARLAGGLQVDVAVLGGGVAGLTAALLLKRDGARVAVLEAAPWGAA